MFNNAGRKVLEIGAQEFLDGVSSECGRHGRVRATVGEQNVIKGLWHHKKKRVSNSLPGNHSREKRVSYAIEADDEIKLVIQEHFADISARDNNGMVAKQLSTPHLTEVLPLFNESFGVFAILVSGAARPRRGRHLGTAVILQKKKKKESCMSN